jgi:hypothetical protein
MDTSRVLEHPMLRELSATQIGHAEYYVKSSKDSPTYGGRYGETSLLIDAVIYAETMAPLDI